jgi:uncharacterized protein YodC (DUF2158 family)
MPENGDQAFQHLVQVLEEAVRTGANAVGLEWEGQDLSVVHYFGSMGRAEALIPHKLGQEVIQEIVSRSRLADRARGKMWVCLLGKDYEVVIDERDDFGESAFTLTLKKSKKKEGKTSSEAGNTMSETVPSKFKVGDKVRVKHGVKDVDFPDIPLGGWAGTISDIDIDGMYRISWSKETLEKSHPIYRKRCERDGTVWEASWMAEYDLEPYPGGPLCMEQPTNIITPPLSADAQEDRNRMVFGLTSDDPLPYDNKATELTYFNYLKANLTFPFAARFTEHVTGRNREVTVTGMCDDFPIAEGFGVVCEVLDGGEKGEMPLSELEVEPGSLNYQTVDDYITWFVNVPEAEADGDLDEDRDEEYEDDGYDEEEYGLDDEVEDEFEEEPPPPRTRQKTGRNDPCPCGSGKKFKKCCLKKQGGSDLID